MAKGGISGKPSRDNSVIKGTGGDDVLTDYGLTGVTLAGGRGNDTYVIYNTDTVIAEAEGEGDDTVQTDIDWTLGAWIENLTLTGTGDVSGTGNELDNVLLGNSGANLLTGLGGADHLDGAEGDDTLYGGDGDDILIGGSGSNLLDGGDGIDIAVFGGPASDYSFERIGDEIHVIGVGGTDILRKIEFLSFGDMVIAASDIPSDDVVPQAVDDLAAGLEGVAIVISVLSNDLGNGLSVALATNGAKGLVTINDDGTVTYRPADGASGQDTFTYTIADTFGRTSDATVSVEIDSVNDSPVAQPDSYSAKADQTFVSANSVLENDSDPDGDPLTISAHDAVSAAGGSVQMNQDGTFSYTPVAGFSGTDSFSYTASDGNGGHASATVSVAVEDPDAIPYYVEALLYPEDYKRLNYPDAVGTSVTVTYTFLQSVPDYYGSAKDSLSETFQSLTDQQMQITREALTLIETFTSLNFVEVTNADDSTLAFAIKDWDGDNLGSGSAPLGNSVGTHHSDVWIDADVAGDAFFPGTKGYYVLLHEIGHAIGFGHPSLPAAEDNRQYTVMEYVPHPSMGGDVTGYQLFDIAALQHLYGTNFSSAAGQDVYSFADFDGLIKTVWDGGGHDTFDMSAATYGVTLDLNARAFSTVAGAGSNNIGIAFGTIIEDAVGSSHNDLLTGNDVANVLNGGSGDDRLTGGVGADVFDFDWDWGNDVVTDFVRGEDLLDLRGSGATQGELTITSDGSDTKISYGDDLITLLGVSQVTEDNFIWDAV